jgi:hypothetical protein
MEAQLLWPSCPHPILQTAIQIVEVMVPGGRYHGRFMENRPDIFFSCRGQFIAVQVVVSGEE